MDALHGGKREGAGRPKGATTRKATTAQAGATVFDDPLAYLCAVATGAVPGEALRVAAAKAALPFTTPKARAPVASPAPAKLRAKVQHANEEADLSAWAAKAASVRKRFKGGADGR